jgi:hypothetical protein
MARRGSLRKARRAGYRFARDLGTVEAAHGGPESAGKRVAPRRVLRKGVRTCRADPDPKSALGLCADHDRGNRLWSEGAHLTRRNRAGGVLGSVSGDRSRAVRAARAERDAEDLPRIPTRYADHPS